MAACTVGDDEQAPEEPLVINMGKSLEVTSFTATNGFSFQSQY